MTSSNDSIKNKLNTLLKERSEYVTAANLQVAYFDGQIAALQGLLAEINKPLTKEEIPISIPALNPAAAKE